MQFAVIIEWDVVSLYTGLYKAPPWDIKPQANRPDNRQAPTATWLRLWACYMYGIRFRPNHLKPYMAASNLFLLWPFSFVVWYVHVFEYYIAIYMNG